MRTYNNLAFVAAAITLVVASCAEAPPKPDTMAPVASATASAAKPALDMKLFAAAREARDVREVRLYLEEDGATRKSAVYHGDATRIPEAVTKLVEARYPDAAVRHYEYELYGEDEYVHELELDLGEGEEVEVSVREDGTLKYIETKGSPDSLSETIKSLVATKVPGGTIEEVEIKEGPELYQIQVRVKPAQGLAAHYLVFEKDGALVRHHLRIPAFIEVPAP